MSDTLQKAKECITKIDEFISNQSLESMDNVIIEAEEIGKEDLADFIRVLRERKIEKENL